MVTEYNRNVIMRRRAEAAMAAEELRSSGAAATKPADAVEAEAPASRNDDAVVPVEEKKADKPKKTDAEKLKKKRS